MFIKRMIDMGYNAHYLYYHDLTAQCVLHYGKNDSVSTYEDVFNCIVKDRNLSQYTTRLYKNCLGRIATFVEDGIFLQEKNKQNQFMRPQCSHKCLLGEFKQLVNFYIDYERNRKRLKESSIMSIVFPTSSFLLFFQKKGYMRLCELANQHTIIQAFGTEEKRCNSYNAVASIKTLLKVAVENNYFEKECKRILSMIPDYPKRHKAYDYLTKEEKDRLEANLDNEKLSMRDRAICKIAFYTGMRRGDIANLRIDNVCLDTNEIHFYQQKTGEEVKIPLLPVVGNAIYDYIVNERPNDVIDDHIFIDGKHASLPMSTSAIYGVTTKLFSISNVRMEKGRRKGVHIFRHALASDLLDNDIDHHVISKVLGHTTLSSIKSYLDSSIEHLRECSLDISQFLDVKRPQLEPYLSPLKRHLNEFREYCIIKNIWSWHLNIAMRSIDNHFLKRETSQENLNEWCQQSEDESLCTYKKRIESVNSFIDYMLVHNYILFEKIPFKGISNRKRGKLSSIYHCKDKSLFEEFEFHRKKSGRWSNSYGKLLHSLDDFCASIDLPNDEITQNEINLWCQQRPSENVESRGKRVTVINTFVKFANMRYNRGLFTLENRIASKHFVKLLQKPHFFTDKELDNFFYALYSVSHNRNNRMDSMKQITCPVVFLLLYSSGMRPIEVRKLDVEDVDLKDGVINIRKTKGFMEHRVALHPSMKKVMVAYDQAIERFVPNRKCFFPNCTDHYYHLCWTERAFKEFWYLYNDAFAVPYSFRHNYATKNIDSWPSQENIFNKRMLYLSRSMGHANIDATMYYYTFTTEQSVRIRDKKSNTLNEVIPNMTKYFVDDENK